MTNGIASSAENTSPSSRACRRICRTLTCTTRWMVWARVNRGQTSFNVESRISCPSSRLVHPLPCLCASDVRQQAAKRLGAHRLDQMLVKTSLFGSGACRIVAVARHRDQTDLFILGLLLAQLTGDLVAIHALQPDVEQDELGMETAGNVQRRLAARRGSDLMALDLQQHGRAVGH